MAKQNDSLLKSPNNFEDLSDKVAITATRAAIVAGVIALGATLISNDKTKQKVANEAGNFMGNIREILNLLRDGKNNEKKSLPKSSE